MTISHMEIQELKDVQGWFKITFKSTDKGDKQTITEMIVSESALRLMRNQFTRALGEKPDYSDMPDNLRKFMEDER